MSIFEPTEEQEKFIKHIEAQVNKKLQEGLKKYGADMQQIHTTFRVNFEANLERLVEANAALDTRLTAVEQQLKTITAERTAGVMADKIKELGWKAWEPVVPPEKQLVLKTLMGGLPTTLQQCKSVDAAQVALFKSGEALARTLNLPGKPAGYVHLKRRNAAIIGTLLFATGGAIGGVVGAKRANKQKGAKASGEAPQLPASTVMESIDTGNQVAAEAGYPLAAS